MEELALAIEAPAVDEETAEASIAEEAEAESPAAGAEEDRSSDNGARGGEPGAGRHGWVEPFGPNSPVIGQLISDSETPNLARQRFRLQDIGDGCNVVEHDDRDLRLRQRRVSRDRDDTVIIRMQQRFADRGAIDFKLRMGMALEAFDNYQIDRT